MPIVAALQRFRAHAKQLGYPAMTNAEAGTKIVEWLKIEGKPTVLQIEDAITKLQPYFAPDKLMEVPPGEAQHRSAVEAGL